MKVFLVYQGASQKLTEKVFLNLTIDSDEVTHRKLKQHFLLIKKLLLIYRIMLRAQHNL